MNSGGGGTHWADAVAPTRKTAVRAAAAGTITNLFDSVAMTRFMAPSLARRDMLVVEALLEVRGQLRALVGREHRRDRLVETCHSGPSVPRDVAGRGGRRRSDRLRVELVGHERGSEG